MATTVITKNSSTASAVPVSGDLTQGELAVNVTDKRLFTKNSGGTVVELGTNPASLALPNGTANGVAYLNGSKVVTTGSAIQFDGTNLGLGGAGLSVGVAGMPAASFLSATAGRSGATYWSDTGSNNTAYAYFFGNVFTFGTSTNHPISFIQNGSEQMRLTSTGLGIGTSSPGSKLDVSSASNGVVKFTSGKSGWLYADSAGIALSDTADLTKNGLYINNTSNYIALYTGSTGAERMRLDSSGNLGLGVTSFGTSAAKVIGLANATAPTSSPAGMGQLYVEGGALKYRGSSGTVTTIANA